MCATEHTRYLEEHHHRGCPSEIDQLQIPTPSRARAWFSGSDFMIVPGLRVLRPTVRLRMLVLEDLFRDSRRRLHDGLLPQRR